MPLCPDYRLRLFLSVDLVGSTAYKAGEGNSVDDHLQSPFPLWVDRIGHFYSEFPRKLGREYEKRADAELPDLRETRPHVWKTIGDEIVLCTRLHSSEHMALCIDAFLRTLESYGDSLEKSKISLDVKGAAWVAAFPTPNITVPVADTYSNWSEEAFGLQTDEDLEAQAEKEPWRFDFLGKDIDAGFRITKHSSAERLALSVELAYLLASACAEGGRSFRFSYSGRDTMKGVVRGRPYPLISIDTERRSSRRAVRALERAMTGERDLDPHMLRSFLAAFIDDEDLIAPVLSGHGRELFVADLPQQYIDFKASWRFDAKEGEQRDIVETESSLRGQEQPPALGVEIPRPDKESLRAIHENFQRYLSKFSHD